MGIYIRGMEMPTSCEECILDHKFFKWLGCNKHVSRDMIVDGKRSPACPLIPVPPHGRLIDADELLSQYKGNIWTAQTDYAEGLRDVANDIKQAPAVIEAEEAEG